MILYARVYSIMVEHNRAVPIIEQTLQKVRALIIFVLLHTASPIIRIASVEIKEPTNACSFVLAKRPDGSV